MKCTPIDLPGGGTAIVCTSGRTRRCRCGNAQTKLCDWKLGHGRTCDAALCDACTHEPAPGKDLCPEHAAKWKERQAAKGDGNE